MKMPPEIPIFEETKALEKMDIQTQKIRFIEEYLRITDEVLIEKLSAVLRNERRKNLKAQLKPMSSQEFFDKLNRSEADIEQGRVYSQEEVINHLKKRYSQQQFILVILA